VETSVGQVSSMNATCNWWSDDSGPASLLNPGGGGQPFGGNASVLASATVAPWLIYNTDSSTDTGFQLPAAITVTPVGENTAADNDFRVLQNAIGCAVTGQTININGTFDWRAAAPLANAAYLSSYLNTTYQDIRGIEIPDGVNDLTITSPLSNAHIIGVGDVADPASAMIRQYQSHR
jgi:hypothetical protein